MTACYLDSNFLVNLKDENAVFHDMSLRKAEDLVKKKVKLYISPLVLDEFIYALRFILRNKSRTTKEVYLKLKEFIQEIFDLPRIYIVGTPYDRESQLLVLDLMEKYFLGPRDAYHLLIIKINRIDAFATFDGDFKKVFSLGIVRKV